MHVRRWPPQSTATDARAGQDGDAARHGPHRGSPDPGGANNVFALFSFHAP
jgi:hypothetical protein